MENEIKYQAWPKQVKVVTALSHKKLSFKEHSVPTILGWLVLVLGILELVYQVVQGESFSVHNSLSSLSYIIIGVANLVSGNSIKWITTNSSWKERFEHKSSAMDKLINILVSIVLLACLYAIFFY